MSEKNNNNLSFQHHKYKNVYQIEFLKSRMKEIKTGTKINETKQ